MTHIPTMLDTRVNEYVELVAQDWSGVGAAVECGAWLGATTAYLGRGLRRAGYDRPIHVFDRFEANQAEVIKARAQGIELIEGQDTTGVFHELTGPHVPDWGVEVHRGRIERARWDTASGGGGPIEFFIQDACKYASVFMPTVMSFGPSWVPGVTIVFMMDYWFHQQFPEGHPRRSYYSPHVRFIERHRDCFELLRDFGPEHEPAVFRYTAPIDWRNA